MEISKKIKARLKEAGKRFWAGDNISDFIEEGEKQQLVDELTSKFEEVLSNGDLIYDFYIFKINNKSNVYKIILNGSPDHFLKIMKDKNYDFDIQDQIWVLK